MPTNADATWANYVPFSVQANHVPYVPHLVKPGYMQDVQHMQVGLPFSLPPMKLVLWVFKLKIWRDNICAFKMQADNCHDLFHLCSCQMAMGVGRGCATQGGLPMPLKDPTK